MPANFPMEKESFRNGDYESINVNKAFRTLAVFTAKYRDFFMAKLIETQAMYQQSGLRLPMNIEATPEMIRDIRKLKTVFGTTSSNHALEAYSDLFWDIHFREPRHEEEQGDDPRQPVDFQSLVNIMNDPSMREALRINHRRIMAKRRAGKDNGWIYPPEFPPELKLRAEKTLGMPIDDVFCALLHMRLGDIE